MFQVAQTALEKDVKIFDQKKPDDSYRYGRLLTALSKTDSLAVSAYDGELLHYATHQGKMRSLDISDVKLESGVARDVQTFKLIHKNKCLQPSCLDTHNDNFYVGTNDGEVAIFNRVSGKCLDLEMDRREKVAAIKVMDGHLHHVGFDGYLLVRNLEYGRIVHSWISTKCPLSSMIVKSGSELVVGSWDSNISQIDVRAKSCSQIKCGNSPIRDIKLHDDGNILVAAHGIGGLRSWDLRKTSTCLRDYGLGNGHSDVINTMILLKNRIFTASDDMSVRIFDINRPRCLDRLQGHRTGVIGLCISGTLLIAGNYESFRKYRLGDIENALAQAEELLQRKLNLQESEKKTDKKADRKKRSRTSRRRRR
ncbi:hypothetical protein AAMO2058_001436100 [Amorphochlora amoebiformis]